MEQADQLCFGLPAHSTSSRHPRCSVAQCIKERIGRKATPSINFNSASHRGNFDLSRAVTSKMEDGNIKAALRLLCSEDKPAESTDATLAAMIFKHPAAAAIKVAVPDPASFNCLQVTESDIMRAVKAFPAGSSGGPDG